MTMSFLCFSLSSLLPGEYFIPASQRPDGTWRKARKVKDGYVPQEEVPVYENKGVQWLKSKPNLPPGLSVEAENPETKAKKSKKKKHKKKEEQPPPEASFTIEEVTDSFEQMATKQRRPSQGLLSATPVVTPTGPQSNVDAAKRLRNLRKKLKQIDDLKAKVDAGEVKVMEKEQEEKLAKRQEVVDEIEELVQELSDV
ncbi:hypothetical protein CAPTEDRAFT_222778 [Capitella teleta]|uniref:WIBG Mago-binding domain-containing protein n=1 Tax=Capitella teleta TaxID=283909 RepID=R7VLY4_CAPTE|nr:hypothetical protein CAPTEDRAFT_222778 [Capitella teleta]|eukprot:ELU18030.1 hypothetical protein CAPTEDRAFT_222778 [Capitella teleta]